jgi:hypothetical protein
VRTIQKVFPVCRMYREVEKPSDAEIKSQGDLANMIIFCVKSDRKFGFREPVEADYLGSEVRRSYLMPQHEIPSSEFEAGAETKEILNAGEEYYLYVWQQVSSLSHWHGMRQVAGAQVWEFW